MVAGIANTTSQVRAEVLTYNELRDLPNDSKFFLEQFDSSGQILISGFCVKYGSGDSNNNPEPIQIIYMEAIYQFPVVIFVSSAQLSSGSIIMSHDLNAQSDRVYAHEYKPAKPSEKSDKASQKPAKPSQKLSD